MKLSIINKAGEIEKSQLDVNDSVFSLSLNSSLLNQYLRVYREHQNQAKGAVLTRAQVRGGGRKPWKQKGTGRARQGSIRSPQWVGGGVVHGPSGLRRVLTITKKMKSKALSIALSLRAATSACFIAKDLKLSTSKTADFIKFMSNSGLEGSKLFIVQDANKSLINPTSNVSRVRVVPVSDVNAFEVLSNKFAIIEESALDSLYTRLGVTK